MVHLPASPSSNLPSRPTCLSLPLSPTVRVGPLVSRNKLLPPPHCSATDVYAPLVSPMHCPTRRSPRAYNQIKAILPLLIAAIRNRSCGWDACVPLRPKHFAFNPLFYLIPKASPSTSCFPYSYTTAFFVWAPALLPNPTRYPSDFFCTPSLVSFILFLFGSLENCI